MLTNYRKSLDTKKAELKFYIQAKQQYTKQLAKLEKESNALTEAREIFQKAAILTQNHLAKHLSVIVTKALRATFHEKDVYFKVEFTERRNTTECDMWIEENGYRYSLFESRGFGMTDVISFALRVAYILLHKTDNVLIIDEPYRNLGKDKHEVASQMIRELAEELNMQFIICTHSDTLISFAHKSFHVKQRNEISEVIETS